MRMTGRGEENLEQQQYVRSDRNHACLDMYEVRPLPLSREEDKTKCMD